MTFLIVDDEAGSLHSIYQAINQIEEGYNVLKAPNGKIAFEIAKKHLPDLVITDWEMPEMNGIALLQALKAHRHTADIPVIMATGIMTSSQNLQTALDAGAVDYVRKPIDPIELRARIQSVLRLSESFKEIKSLNATKDRVFSIISHDLRSPLNLLQGILTIFQLGGFNDPDELQKMMANASLNVQNISELLENLLSWARIQIESEGQSMHPRAIQLPHLLRNTIQLFGEMQQQKDIQINRYLPEHLPDVWVDPEAVKLVLRNLISNALKFTPRGGQVSIRIEEISETTLKIYVQDTGVGMSPATQEKLFLGITESQRGTNNERGTGLGLMLCRDFVEWNGGEIGVTSAPGAGSTFWFTLPSHRA
ncbi:MAG: ATP-binding protein [Bernardetiaceae bacterium]